MREERCKNCGKKLGEFDGSFSVICPRCHGLNEKIYEDKLRQELSLYMEEFTRSQEREENFKATIRQLAYANQQLDAYNKLLLQETTNRDIIDID